MYYVLVALSNYHDVNHVLGVFTSKELADQARRRAMDEYRAEQDPWLGWDRASHVYQVSEVPDLNQLGHPNYNWTPFRKEPIIRWGKEHLCPAQTIVV